MKQTTRGVIQLKNIPHGFYEDEMKKYFSQFGKVYHTQVVRSKKTNKSKGSGYVMFANVDSAKDAAEAMHNYVFFEKVLKCRLLNVRNLPKDFSRKPKGRTTVEQHKINHNISSKSKEDDMKLARKQLALLRRRMKSLQDMGIDYQCDIVNNPITTQENE